MSRLLLPREHGAYVQLLAPLTLALIVSRFDSVAVLFAIAACGAFVANEPLLVLLGHRGKRAREQGASRARRMLAILAPLVVAAAASALVLANWNARVIAAVVAVPTAALIALGIAKRQRSLLGESIAVVALTGAAAPVAAAGGASLMAVSTMWLAWAIGFGCSTLVVHRVIDRGKQPRQIADIALAIGFSCIACASWFAARKFDAFDIAIPLAAGAAIVASIAPRPTKLRVIGFATVGATLLSIAVQL